MPMKVAPRSAAAIRMPSRLIHRPLAATPIASRAQASAKARLIPILDSIIVHTATDGAAVSPTTSHTTGSMVLTSGERRPSATSRRHRGGGGGPVRDGGRDHDYREHGHEPGGQPEGAPASRREGDGKHGVDGNASAYPREVERGQPRPAEGAQPVEHECRGEDEPKGARDPSYEAKQ